MSNLLVVARDLDTGSLFFRNVNWHPHLTWEAWELQRVQADGNHNILAETWPEWLEAYKAVRDFEMSVLRGKRCEVWKVLTERQVNSEGKALCFDCALMQD